MSFGNFSSYLAKKNCQQQNYCCLQGPSGERGPTGAKGDTGPTGPGVPNENFVFGWTGSNNYTNFGQQNQEYWLIPGGQIDRAGYPAGIQPTLPVPSMAVAYNSAEITAYATHISGGGPSGGPDPMLFTFKIYSFCRVHDTGLPGDGATHTNIVEIGGGCHCDRLDTPISAGCAVSDGRHLAVSITPTAALTVGTPISISIALYSQSPLTPPG